MAATPSAVSSRSAASRSPVVVPSTLLDSHLHSKAAHITKRRFHEKSLEASFGDGSHDDDPMTPPDVLLKKAAKQAKQLLNEVGVASRFEEDESYILDTCIRCVALARIVHGDDHWILAKMHIQLAHCYLHLRSLPQQALQHAVKGRDSLLAPGSPLMSHDAAFEVRCQLVRAHSTIGHALTTQGELSKAEQELVKGKRVLTKAKQLHTEREGEGGTVEGVEVEVALLNALARLHLKQDKLRQAQEEFTKAIDLTRTGVGPNAHSLIPMLRGRATAEARLNLYETAEQTLQEALVVTGAEQEEGEDREMEDTGDAKKSEVVGELLQAQARLAAAQLRAGRQLTLKPIEDKFSKAHKIFNSLNLESKCMQCKEEWALMLASQPDSKERAIPMLKELVEAKKVKYGELDEEVGHTAKLLATVYLSLGWMKQAKQYLQQARDAYNCSLGRCHRETLAAIQSLHTISGKESEDQKKKPLFKSVF